MTRPRIESYRDLEAWQLGMKLVEEVYTLTRLLPPDEVYGLGGQLRRASVGVPSNVAEGQQYGFGRNYLRFVSMALGCEAEVQTQLELVVRLKLARQERVQPVMDLASQTGRLLRGLKRSITHHIQHDGKHESSGPA